MTIYAGLDVSDKTTHVCLVDGEGVVLRRDVVATDPDVLAKWLRSSGDTILNREFRTLATYSDPATFPRAPDGQIKHFNVA